MIKAAPPAADRTRPLRNHGGDVVDFWDYFVGGVFLRACDWIVAIV
jgi:hypothetical protein